MSRARYAPVQRGQVDLELVVPAFNEAARLPATLAELTSFLAGQRWRSRVVVVDNGSTDGTATIVSAQDWDAEVVVVGCSRPGKGAAVRRGIAGSGARFVGFVDADLSTPVSTLTRAVAELEGGAAAAIASRHAPGAELAHPQPVTRRLGGSVFRALARQLVPGVHDTQCGFKVFDRLAVQFALKRCHLSGFAFDVELLRQIRRVGGRIAEVPVVWTDDERSTFRPLRDGSAAFADLFRLYRADLIDTARTGAR
ncbi:glycosyltransferase [Micromonospora eburnea]|uniref:Glycosyltransferase involved in cell wall bisynthesis n=1 Tax=Micromonospora eburnea TaxID=227316 RepID=A0A1C6VL37_9ACTN|nr:glycosyltransferase [Micromonospora eburnea]SCL66610.1 Glycosyltransferase involved in cell wall bisynthesis [Micromonospora eburnea]